MTRDELTAEALISLQDTFQFGHPNKWCKEQGTLPAQPEDFQQFLITTLTKALDAAWTEAEKAVDERNPHAEPTKERPIPITSSDKERIIGWNCARTALLTARQVFEGK